MNNTAQKLKKTNKKLANKRRASNQERESYKRKASSLYRKTPEYGYWFSNSDYDRVGLRYNARHHFLAYALVRGRAYRTVEKRCDPNNGPSISSITSVLEDHRDFESIEVNEWLDKVISVDGIRGWLKGKPMEPFPRAEIAA